ncbi:MAG: FAD-dependent monooxygenase [Cyclobacteriaceae bacterium]|nr:FAD-dependent monooxygenase [Cyclobacteriaceae bacterium HetDA_MAG_MS6]
MKNEEEKIVILGAGLVGSLLATLLQKKGFEVTVMEKRSDPRSQNSEEGRSINLALSHRGIRSLKEAGIYEELSSSLIPMKGRMIHDIKGDLTIQPYGKAGQFINSVSRKLLNNLLISKAEQAGVHFQFGAKCEKVDLQKMEITLDQHGHLKILRGDLIIGADGAFSSVRKKMMLADRFNYKQYYIDHGYVELTIPATSGKFAMEPNYLHIWPRGQFMLIALPNPNHTFTCTLFFPFEGTPSFAHLATSQDLQSFFAAHFPDALKLMPDLDREFFQRSPSSMVTVECYPWVNNRAVLIGDAAHAIVPFYGQGMNAGFEDCRLFMSIAETHHFDWDLVLDEFQRIRKKDADAISELALSNFIEMRDKVADDSFLRRKKIEALLHEKFPEDWIPLYSMVTFSDLPYSEALKLGRIQEKAIETLPENPDEDDLRRVVELFNDLRQVDRTIHQ